MSSNCVVSSIMPILSVDIAVGENNNIAAVSATVDAVVPKISCDVGMHEHPGL